MKRNIIGLLLILTLVVSTVVGCSSSGANDQGTEPAATEPTATEPTVTQDAATEDFNGVTLTIASVNNPPFLVLEEKSAKFTEETGIQIVFETLSENEVRSKIQQDVGFGGGNYDLVTLGTTDMATYLNSGWTVSLDDLFASMSDEEMAAYDKDDMFGSVLQSCSDTATGKLCALPFYSESTMICYNTEIFDALGLTMPDEPTWDDILELAKQCDAYSDGSYDNVAGIAIRGKAGYGENQYIFSSIMNSFGGQYYDTDWNTAYDSEEVRTAWEFYKELLGYAEDSPTTCGYTECLNLFTQGQAAIYYDATVSAATFESDDSAVKGKVGYAKAPSEKAALSATIGGWGIAITSGSKNPEAAFKFLTWATSKEYIELVGDADGWTSVPSGTRASLYENSNYKDVASFAEMTAASISSAQFSHPCINDTPYVGTSLPNLPEYSSWGTTIAEELSSYVAGTKDLDAAINQCVAAIDEAAEEGGYR